MEKNKIPSNFHEIRHYFVANIMQLCKNIPIQIDTQVKESKYRYSSQEVEVFENRKLT